MSSIHLVEFKDQGCARGSAWQHAWKIEKTMVRVWERAIKQPWSDAANLVRMLPLVSGLPDCRWVDVKEATKEIFITFLLSTSPIWLGSLITFGVDQHRQKTISQYYVVLKNTLRSGEMLIYATAAIAPLFYFALVKSKDKSRDYPSRTSHIVSALLIFMIGTALFGVQRSGVKMDPDFVLPSSLYLYGFAMVVIFLATIYRNWRDVPPEVIRTAETLPVADEEQFTGAAKAHRND
ncbi:MAG TPA: hypothetical protein VHX61_05000 [Rhizomicrobium sp.]|nr:hypothetical protein [Rhizomicrobium sp.]